jgi:hypothetical protein
MASACVVRATPEVGAARCVGSAAHVATARGVATATAAMRLCQCGSGAQQHRTDYAGRQKKASALGIHDSHPSLPIALIREYSEPYILKTLLCTTRFKVFGVHNPS